MITFLIGLVLSLVAIYLMIVLFGIAVGGYIIYKLRQETDKKERTVEV